MDTEETQSANARFFVTAHGREFLLDEFEEMVANCTIEEIAHSLSLQCRYQGHCREFYSVADHSLLVNRIVADRCGLESLGGDDGDRRVQRAALLHDAMEAYLPGGDIISPWKGRIRDVHPGFSQWLCDLESVGWRAIAAKFDLPTEIPGWVLQADMVALMTERRDLMPQPQWPASRWLADIEEPRPHREIIRPMRPREAEDAFLAAWREVWP